MFGPIPSSVSLWSGDWLPVRLLFPQDNFCMSSEQLVSGFQSTLRANLFAQKIVAAKIAQTDNQDQVTTFYSPDNCTYPIEISI